MKCVTIQNSTALMKEDKIINIEGIEHAKDPYPHVPVGSVRFPVGDRLSAQFEGLIKNAIVIKTKAKRTLLLVEERERPKERQNPTRVDILLEEQDKTMYIPKFDNNIIVHIKPLAKYMSVAGSPKKSNPLHLILTDPFEPQYAKFDKDYPAHPTCFKFIEGVRFLATWAHAPGLNEYLCVMTPGSKIRIRTKMSADEPHKDVIIECHESIYEEEGTIIRVVPGIVPVVEETEEQVSLPSGSPGMIRIATDALAIIGHTTPSCRTAYVHINDGQCYVTIINHNRTQTQLRISEEAREELLRASQRVIAYHMRVGEEENTWRRTHGLDIPASEGAQSAMDAAIWQDMARGIRVDIHRVQERITRIESEYRLIEDYQEQSRMHREYEGLIRQLENWNRQLVSHGERAELIEVGDLERDRAGEGDDIAQLLARGSRQRIENRVGELTQRIYNLERRQIYNLERRHTPDDNSYLLATQELIGVRSQLARLRQWLADHPANDGTLGEEIRREASYDVDLLREIRLRYLPDLSADLRETLFRQYDERVSHLEGLIRRLIELGQSVDDISGLDMMNWATNQRANQARTNRDGEEDVDPIPTYDYGDDGQ